MTFNWIKWCSALLLAGLLSAVGQDKPTEAAPTDQGVLNAAKKAFDDGLYEMVDELVEGFSNRFPGSKLIPAAVLLDGQSLIRTGKQKEAAQLLIKELKQAGASKAEFLYWIGEAYFQAGDFSNAQKAFGRVLTETPNSTLVLAAGYRQAESLARDSKHEMVIKVLNDPKGSFRRAANGRKGEELYALGLLLLGESLFSSGQYDEWVPVRDELSKMKLSPDLYWRWEHLNCRNHLAEERFSDARDSASNLVRLAESAKDAGRLAMSVALLGETQLQMGQVAEAAKSFERNLAAEVPERERKSALLKTAELVMNASQFKAAILKLEQFAKEFPKDDSMDFVHLKLGQLFLAKTLDVGAGSKVDEANTERAFKEFNHLINSYPKSPHLSVALLGRAQCLELKEMIEESLSDLQAALKSLKPSEEQATARFKMGDLLVRKGDLEGATTHYLYVFQQMTNVPQVEATLADRAGYQAVKTFVAREDLTAAQGVASEMKKRFGDRSETGEAILLLSRSLVNQGNAAQARSLIEGLGKGQERVIPELDLALAESHLAEGNWTNALTLHQAWIGKHSKHESVGKVEFNLGWLYHQSGQEERAFQVYTNYVVQYSKNPLTQAAQDWVAGYYFRNGDVVNAELAYQRVFQNTNFPSSEITWRAQLMAGRVAQARQGWNEAHRYFEGLIQQKGIPSEIEAEAFYALGDLTIAEDAKGSVMERFGNAINIFEKLTQRFPESRFVPLAWGRIADCHAQLAGTDKKRYDMAINFYGKVLGHPNVDISAKSAAQFGLAVVTEAKARRKVPVEKKDVEESLKAFLRLAYVDGFVAEGQDPDPFWTAKAIIEAGRILEELGEKTKASEIFKRGGELLPGYRKQFAGRIQRLEANRK